MILLPLETPGPASVRVCPGCDQPLVGYAPQARYHGDACRKWAARHDGPRPVSPPAPDGTEPLGHDFHEKLSHWKRNPSAVKLSSERLRLYEEAFVRTPLPLGKAREAEYERNLELREENRRLYGARIAALEALRSDGWSELVQYLRHCSRRRIEFAREGSRTLIRFGITWRARSGYATRVLTAVERHRSPGWGTP